MPVATLSEKVRFIEGVFGAGKLARNCLNIDVRCPFCLPKDRSKKKLAIRVDDDRNHCWVCGWQAHTLAPLLWKCGLQEKLNEYRDRFMPDAARRRFDLEGNVPVPEVVALPKDFRLLVTAPDEPDARAAWQYIRARGLSERDMWYFKLGISSEPRWHRRIIVPSFDALGSLNYFVARAIDRFKRPKYDNPDFDKLPIIFNELNVDWSSRLTICEGTFDMFKCGDNAVPLLGSDLNEASTLFSSLLVNRTPVALALDGDMWETKTLRAAKKLVEYDIDVVLVDTRGFGDPGNASKEEFAAALRAAQPFEWSSMFRTRLDRASRPTLAL